MTTIIQKNDFIVVFFLSIAFPSMFPMQKLRSGKKSFPLKTF